MNAWKQSTAAEIARRLGSEATGDGARAVNHVAPLDQAGPESLSWLGDERFLPQLKNTKAGVVLTPPGVMPPPDCTLIYVNDPDAALCRVLEMIGPESPRVPVGVHSSAVVSPDAEIHERAAVGPLVVVESGARIDSDAQIHAGAYVGENVHVGNDTILWPGVVLRERSRIGQRVIIHPNVTIGADGYGYLQRDGKHMKIPQVGIVVIEDDVEIGANCTIDRARSGETRIRRGTKIDNLVHIAHNCDIGEDCIIVAQTGVSGSSTLNHHVLLGGQVGVGDHLTIGAGAVVVSRSGVTKSLAPGALYRGWPITEKAKFEREQAALRRLPAALKTLSRLQKRVEQLESTTTDNPERDRG